MENSNRPSALSILRGLRHVRGGGQFVRKYGTYVFFVALIALNAIFTPNFLSTETLVNTLKQAFPMILVALGMTLIMSSGGIDISVGAIMAISAAVAARLYTPDAEGGLDVALVPALACGLLAAMLCGLFNGALISKLGIQPIIVTLVVMITGRGLALTVLGKAEVSLSFTPFEDMGLYKLAGVPVQIVIIPLALAAMLFIVKKTVFAKHVEAIGDNHRASRLVGINIPLVTVGVYVLCSVLCGIAGVMEAARTGSVNASLLGRYIELDAIAAVAIGGTSFSGGRARIMGTFIGAIVVRLVTVIVNMNDIPVNYSLIFKAVMVITVLWAQRDD